MKTFKIIIGLVFIVFSFCQNDSVASTSSSVEMIRAYAMADDMSFDSMLFDDDDVDLFSQNRKGSKVKFNDYLFFHQHTSYNEVEFNSFSSQYFTSSIPNPTHRKLTFKVLRV